MKDYLSSNEAAIKFGISARRIQILCEQKRFCGAKRISGVWLIPSDAKKPTDARFKSERFSKNDLSNFHLSDLPSKNSLSLSQVCEKLGISNATAKNWMKSGRLVPNNLTDKNPEFSAQSVEKLLNLIESGKTNLLKQRRNKKKENGIVLYKDYIKDSAQNTSIVQELVSNNYVNYSQDIIRVVIAHYALQFLYQISNTPYLQKDITNALLQNQIENVKFSFLVKDILNSVEINAETINSIDFALNQKPVFEKRQDFLGFVYISLRNLSNRKILGAYYTPTFVVDNLIDELVCAVNLNNKKIIDPCCGTGNFLIALEKVGVNTENVFGQDIDELSVQITRINVALNYQHCNVKTLYTNFIVGDSLQSNFKNKFDIVIGNPPWGYSFSQNEIAILLSQYETASKKGMESYDLFIENGITMLKENGYLYFVVPEALLNVKSHMATRKIILNSASFKTISYIGNVFTGVQCPAIILGIQKAHKGCALGCKVQTISNEFIIKQDRNISFECFNFNITDEEYNCINKIFSFKNLFTLKNNADFALGIVTGNNQEFISNNKTDDNEIVLKGSDLRKFRYTHSDNYISFVPKSFQQVAPTELYRAPEKLLYRFICDTLVFAYDNKQTVSLNSCNILIPHVDNVDIKYVLAILNSQVAAFLFNKLFNSVKILRSHIEQIPMPFVDKKTQQLVVSKVNLLCACSQSQAKQIYDELDNIIMNLYELNELEQEIVKKSLQNKNIYL